MDHREFRPFDIVVHFKHETDSEENKVKYCYLIIAIAKHTETGEDLVIYRNLKELKKCYARPYSMFAGEVDHDKYPDIKQKYRFEKERLSEGIWNL